MATALEIINTITSNMETDFDNRIPAATQENLEQVGQAIMSDKNIMNEFIDLLINKVAVSNLMSKMYKNPLERLKSGSGIPYGSTIEELFINPATDQGFNTDGNLLLKTTKPDGKSCYFGFNRASTYPVSIQKDQLSLAFRDERSFNNFYNGIITSLYSGDAVDEFDLTKKMLGKNIDDGNVLVVESDIAAPKELAKAMTNMSDYFTFESTMYNGYNLVNKSKISSGEKPVKTFTTQEDQVLLIRADVMNEINYEVLASMFHMELAQLKTQTVKVDSFMSKKYDVYAMLVDRNSINVIDKVFETESQYIGSSRMWNIWLHHFQWLYLSMFGNAVAFGKTKTTSTGK